MKTFASLCSGFGLMDIGAIAAGYTPVWGVEIDPKLAEVAQANLKHQIYVADMIGCDWQKFDRPDHLHISPPCQNASIANSNRGETALDKAIAQSCIEAIEHFQPDSFTLENVRGYRLFQSFQAIVDALWGLGYWVNVDVLDSADFGVPQNRQRLILRAVRGGFPLPLQPTAKRVGWYEAIEDLIPSLPETKFAQWQIDRMPEMYRSCLTDSASNASRMATVREVNEQSFAITAGVFRLPSFPPIAFLVNGMANSNGRDVTIVGDSEPSFTVTASQSKRPLRSWLKDGRTVALTTRTIARLQTLPDGYELPGDAKLAGKGIGNGVPCLFAQRILEAIA